MYSLIKKILFKFDAEDVHIWVMDRMEFLYSIKLFRRMLRLLYITHHESLERTIWGIKFPNPVGLAAGFDKDAKYVDPLACLGFGFIEIGTVTPRSQSGNPKPRLFRLPEDKAIINRMGFNNRGVGKASQRLRNRRERVIIGGNIGKNKDTPNEEAIKDYEECMQYLHSVVNYFVVNVSSPNTPGLRALQEKEPLTKLLQRLQEVNRQHRTPRPILLKIAPDLTNEQLDDIIDIIKTTELDGIVATNTTISREGLATATADVEEMGNGGLSGQPLRKRSTEVISYIHQRSNGKIPIIASGGIFTAADAKEKLDAGASLVQVYTGFIYEGPSIVKNICKGLINRN